MNRRSSPYQYCFADRNTAQFHEIAVFDPLHVKNHRLDVPACHHRYSHCFNYKYASKSLTDHSFFWLLHKSDGYTKNKDIAWILPYRIGKTLTVFQLRYFSSNHSIIRRSRASQHDVDYRIFAIVRLRGHDAQHSNVTLRLTRYDARDGTGLHYRDKLLPRHVMNHRCMSSSVTVVSHDYHHDERI